MVKFMARRTVLLRMPLLRNERSSPTLVDIKPEEINSDEQLKSFMRVVLEDPVFREAVVVSGGSLLSTVERLESGQPVTRAKLRRAALALARYLLGTAGRPTPFGLFAGVAVAEFGDTAEVLLGDEHRPDVQPDLGWLTDLVRRWELLPGVLSRMRLMANNLCFVRGDRLVLPHVRDFRDAQELSVHHTAPVRAVLELTRCPVPYEELLHMLQRAMPDAPPDAFARLVEQLVEREILLTDLRPPSTSPAPLGHVIDRLEGGHRSRGPPAPEGDRRRAGRIRQTAARPRPRRVARGGRGHAGRAAGEPSADPRRPAYRRQRAVARRGCRRGRAGRGCAVAAFVAGHVITAPARLPPRVLRALWVGAGGTGERARRSGGRTRLPNRVSRPVEHAR